MTNYDYLIVGAGLFGSTLAYELNKAGYRVLIVDKRGHVGGNIYTRFEDGINVHVYGAHIFHTSNERVWKFINQFADFNHFINSPLANYKGEIYHLPFNMNTFVKIFPNITNSGDVIKKINEEIEQENIDEPKNLEEQALKLVGRTIYTKLIKDYTEKQWGKSCTELPSFIIKRIPVRYTFDNNYFNDKYQGIPIGGYTNIIDNMLLNIDIRLNYDYNKHKGEIAASNIIYTGQLDEYFDYKFGELGYRSLEFKEEKHNIKSYQDAAVINYTSHDEKFTRIIEHKKFEGIKNDLTIISKEYSKTWHKGEVPYYPINDEKNNLLYEKYLNEAKKIPHFYVGGRLGNYKYYDMDDTILSALELADKLLNRN